MNLIWATVVKVEGMASGTLIEGLYSSGLALTVRDTGEYQDV